MVIYEGVFSVMAGNKRLNTKVAVDVFKDKGLILEECWHVFYMILFIKPLR